MKDIKTEYGDIVVDTDKEDLKIIEGPEALKQFFSNMQILNYGNILYFSSQTGDLELQRKINLNDNNINKILEEHIKNWLQKYNLDFYKSTVDINNLTITFTLENIFNNESFSIAFNY